MPHNFALIFEDNRYKLRFAPEYLDVVEMARTKSAEEFGRYHLEKQLELWENATGEKLTNLVQGRIRQQARQLAAIQYAKAANLKLMPHLNEEEIWKTLSKLKNTPPEQLRQEFIKLIRDRNN